MTPEVIPAVLVVAALWFADFCLADRERRAAEEKAKEWSAEE